MRKVVFYSWQSDLPNPCNRGFIQQALEDAAKAITADDTVAIEPVVDRDTQGVAGSPDIASTIFAKINAADVVVADISIVIKPKKGRPTPNPNVLLELGYALKALGQERVILVFNTAFGKVEELPFDLRMRRIVFYNMPEATADRASERKNLEKKLDPAVRSALQNIPVTTVSTFLDKVVSAIENNQLNKIILVRQELEEVFKKIESIQSPKHSEGGSVDDLMGAIGNTQEITAEFLKMVNVMAVINDSDLLLEVYRWFGKIFEKYNSPEGYSGKISNADFDYFKFLGHELFVSLIALLIRERRWDTIARILEEPIPLKYKHHTGGPGNVYWDFASEHMPLLLDESHKRKRISLHADILKERHTAGGLASILPFDEFLGADYFLFLRGELAPQNWQNPIFDWRPWSSIYMRHIPMFLRDAEQSRICEQIVKALKLPSVAEFKNRLAERGIAVNRLFNNHFPDFEIGEEEINLIASR